MPISRILILATILVILLSGCKKPCTIKLEDAPEVRGFKLGMTLDQIRNKIPEIPEPITNEFGFSLIVLDREKEPVTYQTFGYDYGEGVKPTVVGTFNRSDLEGTSVIFLEILDKKLIAIKVIYDDQVKWESVDAFVGKVSETLKINATWDKADQDNRRILCLSDLVIRAGIDKEHRTTKGTFQPYIEIEDFMASLEPYSRHRQKEDKQKKAEEEKRKSFNP